MCRHERVHVELWYQQEIAIPGRCKSRASRGVGLEMRIILPYILAQLVEKVNIARCPGTLYV